MNIFSGIKAIINIQKMKLGGTAKLSIAQITNLLINLLDANRNLHKDKFNEIYELYKKLSRNNAKIRMDINDYYCIAIEIIMQFDKIAPYEKYSGGDETEVSLLLKYVRKETDQFPNEFYDISSLL